MFWVFEVGLDDEATEVHPRLHSYDTISWKSSSDAEVAEHFVGVGVVGVAAYVVRIYGLGSVSICGQVAVPSQYTRLVAKYILKDRGAHKGKRGRKCIYPSPNNALAHAERMQH